MTTETKRKIKADEMRKYRTIKHILSIIKNYDAISLCFSFSDETLQKTNEKTRLFYIKKYLNDFAKDYILNKDYGGNNGREHYHAIARPKYKIFLSKFYTLGNMTFTKIHSAKYGAINTDIKTMANRFYNHATKQTTNGSRLIFARCNRQSESKYKYTIDRFLRGLDIKESEKYYKDMALFDEETAEIEKIYKEYEEEQEEMRQRFFENLNKNKA